MASRADEVATRAIPAVVVTTAGLGRYLSTHVTFSYKVIHTVLSLFHSCPITFSFLLVVKSPTRKLVELGHSSSLFVFGTSGVFAPNGGVGGVDLFSSVTFASGSLGVTVVQLN